MGDISHTYGGSFNPFEHDPLSDFDPLPPGWYLVMIEKAEVKSNKARTGQFLSLQMAVIGETYNGRKLFANINLSNPSAQAVEIGIKELAALGQALGLPALDDSAVLIQKTLMVKVKVKPKDERNDASNDITGYKSAQGQAQVPPPAQSPTTPMAGQQVPPPAQQQVPPSGGQQATTTASPPQAQATGKPIPPWERK